MALPVPPEIWGKIFSLIPPGVISKQELDPTIAPLLLTQVFLWNRISVLFDAQTRESSEPRHLVALCKVIHGWVSRSGDYPLHISYSIHDRRPVPVVNPRDRFDHTDAIRPWTRPAPRCSFPILQYSPSLRDLALHIPLDHSFPAPIHWQTLTRFSGRGIYLNQAYAILQLVANLEEVKLSTDSAPFADAITTMTLPHLHKLTLVNDPVVLEWLTLSCSMASRRRSVRRRR
ncbi:hypothetical protein B0H14DRAFT_2807625 [Mycena olivaceomarginata]|nr:hypothetical protein B0H14DRAFT_2807625 [Mycena olivaceomarginata]